VEQRQHSEHHVTPGDHLRHHLGHLLDVRQQCPMRQHRRARTPGGAAGVEEDSQGLGVHPPRGRPAPESRDQLVPAALTRREGGADGDDPRSRRCLVASCLHRITEPADSRSDGRDRVSVRDHHPGARVGQHPDQLTGGAARVHGDDDHAGPQCAEVRRDELDPVAGRDHHPVAGHHPGVVEALHHPLNELLETTAGHGAPGRGFRENLLVRLLCGRPAQELGDVGVHRSSLAHSGSRLCPCFGVSATT
jgi:hypothetical protein